MSERLIQSVVLLALTSVSSAQQSLETWPIAEYGADRTECRVLDSGVPGPTVLVIGGVHGDEPAGARAARQIAGWSVESGRLAVVEQANPRALAAGKRRSPGLSAERADLNRQFPTRADDAARTELARALWELVQRLRPDYLLDLHEGTGFTRRDAGTVGSSIIADPRPETLERARAMIAAVDATIDKADKRFVLKRNPVLGSLARAATDRLGIRSMILETTRRTQSLAYRVRQHRRMVHALLRDLDMVAHGPDVRVGTAARPGDLCVGVYASTGASSAGPRNLERLLAPERGFVLRRLCVADIREDALDEFDLLIFPGGSGSAQAKALAESGRKVVRRFVEDGGAYLGICAGAYLAADNYSWSLGILDANVIDRNHWQRGRGPVPLEFSDRGQELLGQYGRGRVLCTSPHPEITDGFEEWTRRMVRVAAGRAAAPAGSVGATPQGGSDRR